jgi:hypothetical protein
MPLASQFSKLAATVWARDSIVILLGWSLVSSIVTSLATFRAATTATSSSVGGTHGLSKHFRLHFPLGKTTFAPLYCLVFIPTWHCLLLLFFRNGIISLSLGLHQYLLVFVIQNSMLLTVKCLSFLLEDLVAYANVFFISFIVELAITIGTLVEVQLRSLHKSISAKAPAALLL